MEKLLHEIQKEAENGYGICLLRKEDEIKKIFLSILTKTQNCIDIAQNDSIKSVSESCQPYKKTNSERTHNKIENKKEVNIVAYCFSKYQHDSILPNMSQAKAFDIVATKLNINFHSFKLIRDCFDGHIDNNRRGWWQSPLLPDLQEIYDIYENKSKEEVINEAKNILNL